MISIPFLNPVPAHRFLQYRLPTVRLTRSTGPMGPTGPTGHMARMENWRRIRPCTTRAVVCRAIARTFGRLDLKADRLVQNGNGAVVALLQD